MKCRVLNKFRFTVCIVLLLILLTCLGNLILGFNSAEGSTIVEYKTIKIEPNDTLWDIATLYMPNNMDIREAIYDICQLNNINASNIQAGMEIMIPIYH